MSSNRKIVTGPVLRQIFGIEQALSTEEIAARFNRTLDGSFSCLVVEILLIDYVVRCDDDKSLSPQLVPDRDFKYWSIEDSSRGLHIIDDLFPSYRTMTQLFGRIYSGNDYLLRHLKTKRE